LDRAEPFSFDEWGLDYMNQAPAESYRPLTWDQCREMADAGLIEFGAHTHTHQDFRGRPDEFYADLQTSVEIVRERMGIDSVPFAFPFGSSRRGHAGPELVAAAKCSGVSCGLTTDPLLVDLQSDPFTWGRFNAFAWDTASTLAAKLDGWYSWAPQLKHRTTGTIRRIFRGVSTSSSLP
jgi:peptidoglycan/xylan/chitin deacetylase (PgdA/CDA1 family)